MIHMTYEKVGGGYRLLKRVRIRCPELSGFPEFTGDFLSLLHGKNGGSTRLHFKAAYWWDGATGIRDTKRVLPPSLAHDGGAQISRRSPEWSVGQRRECVAANNALFLRLLIEQGTRPWFARVILRFLKPLKFYADPKNRRKVYTLP